MNVEAVRALVGDDNLVSGFWTMIGSQVLINSGLIITWVIGYFKKQRKLRNDLDKAFLRIRALEKPNEGEPNENASSTLQEQISERPRRIFGR